MTQNCFMADAKNQDRADPAKGIFVYLTCEHAGNIVPTSLRPLFLKFPNAMTMLNSHYGYDIGILSFARQLQHFLKRSRVKSKLTVSLISRLVIDCNRSENSKSLYSYVTKNLDPATRAEIKKKFYAPYRLRVRRDIRKLLQRGYYVVCLSLHSFTPELSGKKRATQMGLLFNPNRPIETEFAKLLKCSWKKISDLKSQEPIKIHFNRPYRGWTDAFVNDLHQEFSIPLSRPQDPTHFVGICVELNQKILNTCAGDHLAQHLSESLISSCECGFRFHRR